MKTIAFYNIKGGVGKTATAVNIAYLASQDGYKTLLWDMDPQGAASYYFRVKPRIKGGVEELLDKKHDLSQHIKGSDYPLLDILPADFSIRNMDLLLGDLKKPSQRIEKLIKPLREEYDLIMIDCAPSISLVSENVFRAADHLLVPTIPTTLSLRTLKQLRDYFIDNNLDTDKLLSFFSMVDKRRQMHRLIVEKPPKKQARFLTSHIAYLSEIERMGLDREPACLKPSNRATQAYRALWHELCYLCQPID